MIKKSGFIFGLAMFISMISCETDFSLNGDYEITPVVFGLLDNKTNTHIIKITKAYLGDGDNLVYAQNPDSNLFETIEATVTEFKNGNETGKSWTLHDTTITNKDTNGIFYAPEQKVYVFYAALDSSCTYKFNANINEGAHTVTGETALIKNFKLSSSVYLNKKIAFAPDNVADSTSYSNWVFTVTEGSNAAIYTYKMYVDWIEHYEDGSSQTFTATYSNSDYQQVDPDVPGAHNAVYRGLDFYKWLGQIIPDNADVERRYLTNIKLRISAGHYELYQYMQVTKPVSSIAQTQPEYTNLLGGRGLFSSRAIIEVSGFSLNKPSRQELCRGSYTGGKVFYSNNPEDVSEDWYWP